MTLSHGGYAKAQPVSDYQAQRRGGRGKAATAVKDEDFVDKLFVANTHDTLLCFSNRGKVYWLKVYELPQASRGSRGKPIVNLLPLQEGEKISACCRSRSSTSRQFVFMATSIGTVKKTPLAPFSRPRAQRHHRRGPADQAISWSGVAITDGSKRSCCVHHRRQGDPLPRGRGAPDGPRGRRRARHQARRGPARQSRCIVAGEGHVLTASENGFGKLTPLEEFPTHGRGGQGVIALQTTDATAAWWRRCRCMLGR